MSVPGADELFRRTATGEPGSEGGPATAPSSTPGTQASEPAAQEPRTPSGRVRHDEKMTVYVTGDELIDLEHARLVLRRLGVGVDRGRLVRTAIAIALADLEADGVDSELVRRLTQA